MKMHFHSSASQRNHKPDKSHILSPSRSTTSLHSDRGTWLMSHSTRTMERKVLMVNFSNSLFTCSFRHFSCCWSGFCTCTRGYHSINIIIFIGTSIIHKIRLCAHSMGTISSLFTWPPEILYLSIKQIPLITGCHFLLRRRIRGINPIKCIQMMMSVVGRYCRGNSCSRWSTWCRW